MAGQDSVNILLVDDQPGKLLSYEVVLQELGENLVKAGSAREALEHLLKNDIAVILVDVCMPEQDGFQLAEMIREHPRWGEAILSDDSAFDLARAIARSHHENWDGTGYPDRLRGERIPLAARIVRIADVYDALRAERPYKRAWSNEEALEELLRMAGTGLDPELARLFVDLRAGSA